MMHGFLAISATDFSYQGAGSELPAFADSPTGIETDPGERPPRHI
jgi:hypothetical protein